jgi:hypothetical protein
MRRAIDDLPSVGVSRLRASGAIRSEDKTVVVTFPDGPSFVVALSHFRWPNGGSWSFVVCPCGRRARTLRLLDGDLCCRECCKAAGLRYRVELIETPKRAAYIAPKLLARLNSETPARLHPRPDGSMLDRRANLEFALRRSLLVQRRHNLRGVGKLRGK